MRELWPEPGEDLDADAVVAGDERPTPPGRPWVAVNMIASVDGATALAGVSGGLGGPADRAMFRALRGIADVVVVGAATVRAEHYGPPRPSDTIRAARVARGQRPTPRIAVVSGRMDLDPAQGLFAEAEERPLVFTGARADAARSEAMAGVATIVRAEQAEVDLATMLAVLADHGATVVLCEGGPSLNGQMVAEGLVDEWCTTVAPMLVAGPSSRPAHGAAGSGATPLRLRRVVADDDGTLLLRYTRA
ncbi:MAG: pyrimidine reductase family protein [Acidimicrobiales bacterium]|jgi:riboflavin biosynthesis pyrimidine reductase|nr:pyrimidine reductase family protein [Acidimicrobiales bacterium]